MVQGCVCCRRVPAGTGTDRHCRPSKLTHTKPKPSSGMVQLQPLLRFSFSKGTPANFKPIIRETNTPA